MTQEKKITVYSLERHQQLRGAGKFFLSKDIHENIFYFTSWRPLRDIRIEFGSLDGDFSATLKIFDRTLVEGKTSQEMKTVDIPFGFFGGRKALSLHYSGFRLDFLDLQRFTFT
jgi:hypothetical protein